MDFGLSPAQTLLRDSVADHVNSVIPLERVRAVFESETGFDQDLYRELGEQGILGTLIAEEYGGSGLGLLEAVIVAQELGRGATPISFHTAAVLAPLLIDACADQEQKQQWLPDLANGQHHFGVIFDTEMTLDHEGRLSGEALWIANAAQADTLLVRCQREVVAVSSSSPGLTIQPLENIDDTRRLCVVQMHNVPSGAQQTLPGRLDDQRIARLRQAVWIALAADCIGASQRGIALAVDYAKQREQFERVIASFQAVKHLCAEMIADVDPLQSFLWYASYAWDRQEQEVAWMAPQLKAHATEVGWSVASKATQVHGGIGFTWECDMHLFYKRIAYDRQLFGTPEELRTRAAALQFPATA